MVSQARGTPPTTGGRCASAAGRGRSVVAIVHQTMRRTRRSSSAANAGGMDPATGMGRDYATVPTEVLSPRALGRATLARQLLLDRADLPPRDAVAHLVGLQAQQPRDPYVALWSRLRAFDPDGSGGCWWSARSCGSS